MAASDRRFFWVEGAIYGVIVLAILCACVALVVGNGRCNAAGGTYVRSAFGMTCVASMEAPRGR